MTRNWSGALHRASLDLLAFLLCMHLVTVALTLTVGPTGWEDHRGRILLLGCELALLALVIVARRSERRTDLHGAMTLTATVVMVATVVAAQDPGLEEPGLQVIRLVGVTPLALVLAHVVEPTARGLVAIASTGVVWLLLWQLIGDPGSVPMALDAWVPQVTLAAAACILRGPMQEEARAMDELQRQLIEDARLVDEAQLLHRAREESRRVVHDEVIGALRAVELQLPRPARQAAVRSALSALTRGPVRTGSHEELLTRARQVPGVEIAVSGEWHHTPPPAVMTALTEAVREALRNVVRHAGVSEARLHFREEGASFTIEVTDAGAGLAAHGTHGFGLSQSISRRLLDAGGTSELVTGPEGTTVRMHWTAPPTAGSAPAAFDLRGRFVLLAVAVSLAHVPLLVRHPGQSVAMAVALWAATGLLSIATARFVGRRRPDHDPTRRSVAALLVTTAASCTLAALGLANQPDGALLSAGWWPVAIALMPPVLCVTQVAPGWAAVPIGSFMAVVATHAAADPSLTPLQPVAALATVVTALGAGAVWGTVFRRGAGDAATAAREHRARTRELAWHTAREATRRLQQQLVAEDVLPFLRDVLLDSADADPAEQQVARARLLAEECRDGLYLETPIPTAARSAIRGARSRGVLVTVRASVDGVGSGTDWRHVASLVEAAPGGQVTIRPGNDATEVAVVPAIPRAVLATWPRPRGTSVSNELGATVVRLGLSRTDPA